ncbi:MAG TPA: hypothetical protein VE988_17330, partial [Gemmataceae bacterium]|nr:hypothetical protein [Gemmataceae bacterium]
MFYPLQAEKKTVFTDGGVPHDFGKLAENQRPTILLDTAQRLTRFFLVFLLYCVRMFSYDEGSKMPEESESSLDAAEKVAARSGSLGRVDVPICRGPVVVALEASAGADDVPCSSLL